MSPRAVTGPLKIRSDGQGGTISGNLQLDKGRFTLGRASAAAAVPQLAGARNAGSKPTRLSSSPISIRGSST